MSFGPNFSQSSLSDRNKISSINSILSMPFEYSRPAPQGHFASETTPGWLDALNRNASIAYNNQGSSRQPFEEAQLAREQDLNGFREFMKSLEREDFAGKESSLKLQDMPGILRLNSRERSVESGWRRAAPAAEGARAGEAGDRHQFKFLQLPEQPFCVEPKPSECSASPFGTSATPFSRPSAFGPQTYPLPIKTKVYKTPLIKDLEPFLFKMFTSQEVTADAYKLTRPQDDILQAILNRKFGKCLTPEQRLQPPALKAELVTKIINTSFNKRPEECYKYFTIRILKHMKTKLQNAFPGRTITDVGMYRHYFEAAAAEAKVPLRDYFYPLNKQASQGSKLNSRYFDRLRSAPAFMAALAEYLSSEATREHGLEVQQKLFSLLKPHDQFVRKRKKTEEQCFADLVDYIANNKHCKFPWTVKELRESQEKFEGMILAPANN